MQNKIIDTIEDLDEELSWEYLTVVFEPNVTLPAANQVYEMFSDFALTQINRSIRDES